MASNHQDLGSTIQELRLAAGLTQDDLSDRAGLAYSTLAKIERGAIKNPSVFTIAAIAKVLETSVEALVNPAAVLETRTGNKSSPIKFVYLDMNGVLVRFFQRAFVRLSEETGLSVDKIETTFWHYNDAPNRGEMTVDEFNQAMMDHLDIDTFDWKSYYLDAVEPIKEMHDCLKQLEGKVPFGILSNTMPGLIEALIEKKIIPNANYSSIIDSSQVGCIKPEPEIYRIAEKAAGVKGGEILFVDDSRTNLMAAEKFGWRVLWFDDYRPEDSVQRVQEALELPVAKNA